MASFSPGPLATFLAQTLWLPVKVIRGVRLMAVVAVPSEPFLQGAAAHSTTASEQSVHLVAPPARAAGSFLIAVGSVLLLLSSTYCSYLDRFWQAF